MSSYFKNDININSIEGAISSEIKNVQYANLQSVFKVAKEKSSKDRDEVDKAICIFAGMVLLYVHSVSNASEANNYNEEILGVDKINSVTRKPWIEAEKAQLVHFGDWLAEIAKQIHIDEKSKKIYFKKDVCSYVKDMFGAWKGTYGEGRKKTTGEIGVLDMAAEFGANISAKTNLKTLDKLCEAICKALRARYNRSKVHFKKVALKNKIGDIAGRLLNKNKSDGK